MPKACARFAAASAIACVLCVLFCPIPTHSIVKVDTTSSLFSGPNNLIGKVKQRQSSHMTCHETLGERSCHFRSICWDRVERTFIYYEEPGQLPLVHTATGYGSDWDIRKDFVRVTNEGHQLPPDKGRFMPLKVLPGPIPGDHVFAPETVHVYFVSHYAENFGHAIGDDILPAFALQSMFGLLTHDVKLLTPRDYAESAGSVGSAAHQRGRRFLHDLGKILSDHPIGEMWNDTLYRPMVPSDPKSKDARHTCFTSLLAGQAKLGIHRDKDRYFSSFADYMIARAMMKFPSVYAAATQKFSGQRVVIIRKKGRRAVLNIDELAEHIRKTFLVPVDIINPAEIKTQEQIAVMLTATLVITPAGGISFICPFVRARAPVIFVGHWSPTWNHSSQLERHDWEPARHVTDLYYDVHFSDITVLPPANLTNPGDHDYATYGAATVNLARMSRIVASGLLIAERELDIPAPSFSMASAQSFADRSLL
jgi:hypothetical protein